MKELALNKKGLCLSTVYVNSNIKLLFQCELGHQWEALPLPIKHKGVWCPHCAKRAKLTIGLMKNIADSRRGKCLSTEYLGNKSKLKWECEFLHQWEATPDSIRSGTWCSVCANNKIFTVEYMVSALETPLFSC